MTALSNRLGCQHPVEEVDLVPFGKKLQSERSSKTSRVKRNPFAKNVIPTRCTILEDGQLHVAFLGNRRTSTR